jgi:hypothetical protein
MLKQMREKLPLQRAEARWVKTNYAAPVLDKHKFQQAVAPSPTSCPHMAYVKKVRSEKQPKGIYRQKNWFHFLFPSKQKKHPSLFLHLQPQMKSEDKPQHRKCSCCCTEGVCADTHSPPSPSSVNQSLRFVLPRKAAVARHVF